MYDILGLSATGSSASARNMKSAVHSLRSRTHSPSLGERNEGLFKLGIISLPSLRAKLFGLWKDGRIHVNIDRRGSDGGLKETG